MQFASRREVIERMSLLFLRMGYTTRTVEYQVVACPLFVLFLGCYSGDKHNAVPNYLISPDTLVH